MPEITATQLSDIIDSVYDMSNTNYEIELRDNYSGRYMFGKNCVGFVTDNPVKLHGAICSILAEWDMYADYSGVTWYELNPQVDSMGLSSILYYPNLTVADE